jgi:hypothetical protein
MNDDLHFERLNQKARDITSRGGTFAYVVARDGYFEDVYELAGEELAKHRRMLTMQQRITEAKKEQT